MNKLIVVLLLLCCAQAEAGEWFKSISMITAVGYEEQSCNPKIRDCGGYTYDIAEGLIGKVSVSQSIYTARRFEIGMQWDHLSGMWTDEETPIDFFGFNLSIRHDWY